jgi:maltodextrin utilization protein YvdJ
MSCPQSEDCTAPHRDRKYRVVHHSKLAANVSVRFNKRQDSHSVDHLVSEQLHRVGDDYIERLSSFQIDDQLQLGRLNYPVGRRTGRR